MKTHRKICPICGKKYRCNENFQSTCENQECKTKYADQYDSSAGFGESTDIDLPPIDIEN